MESQSDSVILLHGLARSDRSMNKLKQALLQKGYRVHNVSYASTRNNIGQLAEEAIGPALKLCPKEHKLHFVTHSLGGILVRQYLLHHEIENLGRVVMLGPPNKGSEVVDKLRDFPGFRFINGEAGLELGTGESSVPNQLGAAHFDLGIIAGTRSVNLILSLMISGTGRWQGFGREHQARGNARSSADESHASIHDAQRQSDRAGYPLPRNR